MSSLKRIIKKIIKQVYVVLSAFGLLTWFLISGCQRVGGFFVIVVQWMRTLSFAILGFPDGF